MDLHKLCVLPFKNVQLVFGDGHAEVRIRSGSVANLKFHTAPQMSTGEEAKTLDEIFRIPFFSAAFWLGLYRYEHFERMASFPQTSQKSAVAAFGA